MVAPGILPPATLVHPCTSYRHSRSRASQLTPACKENPFAFATRSLRGSSPASGLIVRSTSALRPACGPTAMRYVTDLPMSCRIASGASPGGRSSHALSASASGAVSGVERWPIRER